MSIRSFFPAPASAVDLTDLTAPAVPLVDGPSVDPEAIYSESNRAVVCEQLKILYPLLGSGYSRHVFDGGHVVYKVGLHAIQMHELRSYEQPSTYDDVPVAPCRIVWHESGIAILIMETVRPAARDEDLPEWASRVDDHQVGWRASGECVVFDAGERLATKPIPRAFVQRHTLPAMFA